MSPTTEKILSKGHWNVTIRPGRFVEDRVPYVDLDDVLAGSVVRFRGWPVPFVDRKQPIRRGPDWIGQDVDAEIVSHYEAWRFFASGQFSHLRSVSADWRTGAETTRVPQGYTTAIEVWEILFYLTEVCELAARLALSPAGDDVVVLEVELGGLEARCLVVGQHNRAEFMEPYPAPAGPLLISRTLPRDELVAEARSLGVDLSLDFFSRFGWRPSREQVSDHQLELTERR